MEIREFYKEDIQFFNQWEDGQDIFRYLAHSHPRCIRGVQEIEDLQTKIFMIEEEKDIIGALWLEYVQNEVGKLNIYISEEENRNKGYGCEAIKRLVYMGFSDLNLKKIYVRIRSNNKRAIQCCKKCGFTLVNEYPKMRFPDGSYERVLEMQIQKECV